MMGRDCPLVPPAPAGDPAKHPLLARSWRWASSCSQKSSSLEDSLPRRRNRADELCKIAPSLLFSTHWSPPASSSMGPPTISLVQSPGSAAEATVISPDPVASTRRNVSPGACCWSATRHFSWGGECKKIPLSTPKTAIASSSPPFAGFFGRAGTPRTQLRGANLHQPPTGKLEAVPLATPPPPLPEASLCNSFPQPLPKAWRRSCPRVRQSCLSYLRTQGFSCCIPVSRGLLMQAGLRLPRHPPPQLLPGAGVQQGGTHKTSSWLCNGDWQRGPAPPGPRLLGKLGAALWPHHNPMPA